MRQVGDRLIPVGVTSGRVQVLSSEEAAAAADGGSRRNRRRPNQQNGGIDQYVGMAGQDLEEVSFYSIVSFGVSLISRKVDAHGGYASIIVGSRRTSTKGSRGKEETRSSSHPHRSSSRYDTG
jgi:hypothetical protein